MATHNPLNIIQTTLNSLPEMRGIINLAAGGFYIPIISLKEEAIQNVEVARIEKGNGDEFVQVLYIYQQ